MLYTTAQVAKKLGVSTHTVRVWHNEGRFTGQQKGNGVKKKKFLYHSKSVNDYAKTIKVIGKGRGNRVIIKNSQKPVLPVLTGIGTGIGTRLKKLESRIDQLEQKIDYLVKVWS